MREMAADLFGNIILETTFGRIGGEGRTIVAVVKSEDEALQYVRKSLKRLESTPKRLGVGYKIKDIGCDWDAVKANENDLSSITITINSGELPHEGRTN